MDWRKIWRNIFLQGSILRSPCLATGDFSHCTDWASPFTQVFIKLLMCLVDKLKLGFSRSKDNRDLGAGIIS